MKLLFRYLPLRFPLRKFLPLTLLMSMFVFDLQCSPVQWGIGLLFLFCSFLIFRMLDDVFSIHMDRDKIAERFYLNEKNFPKFQIITACFAMIYVIFLFLVDFPQLHIVLILLLASVTLYAIFCRNGFVMPIIPLLKYPVLLTAACMFPVIIEMVLVFGGAGFMMAVYDAMDRQDVSADFKDITVRLTLISGFLIFQPWNNWWLIVVMLIPIVAYLANYKNKVFRPILIYPIAYFITQNIL